MQEKLGDQGEVQILEVREGAQGVVPEDWGVLGVVTEDPGGLEAGTEDQVALGLENIVKFEIINKL